MIDGKQGAPKAREANGLICLTSMLNEDRTVNGLEDVDDLALKQNKNR